MMSTCMNQKPCSKQENALPTLAKKLVFPLCSSRPTKAAAAHMVQPNSQCSTASKASCFLCMSMRKPSKKKASARKACTVPSYGIAVNDQGV